MGAFTKTFSPGVAPLLSLLNPLPVILQQAITPVTSSSFTITSTVDTKNKNADVFIEYGLTDTYGSEIPVQSGVNGIVEVGATLTL